MNRKAPILSPHCIFLLVLLCAGVLAGNTALAQVSKLLPFQGRLTDPTGAAVSDGLKLIQFKIFDAPNGGTAVWAGEVHQTTVNGGLINVLLGTKTPLTSIDFNQQLYLEITVDLNGDNMITAADPPLLPRQVILPVIFSQESALARNSTLLAGHDWTSILVSGNDPSDPIGGQIKGSKIQSQSITASQIAPGSITGNQISSNTITGTQIVPGAIGSNHISTGSITADKLDPALALNALMPAGVILPYGGEKEPAGWMFCDGRALNSSAEQRLFAAISTNFGGGYVWTGSVWVQNTNDFNLPDLRGLFLRGALGTQTNNFLNSGAVRDPDAASRTNAVPGGHSGNKVGSLQVDVVGSHQHYTPAGGAIYQSGSQYSSAFASTYSSFLVSPTGPGIGNETRPRNAYVNYIIKR